ncbi:hypothetical protein L9F63_012029, partial [Diploptera punctata]
TMAILTLAYSSEFTTRAISKCRFFKKSTICSVYFAHIFLGETSFRKVNTVICFAEHFVFLKLCLFL